MTSISRRHFLTITGGLVAAGCTGGVGRGHSASSATSSTSTPSTSTVPNTLTPSDVTVTSVTTPAGLSPNDRVVVMVELAGGNDPINTLVPDVGLYRDLRPTIALGDDDLLASPLLDGYGLHGALAPLLPHLDDGALAIVAGVGFPDPDRSHFVSTDRWMRADRMDEGLGWLGRWLDTLGDNPPALGATSFGSNGQMLLGAHRSGTVIDGTDSFAFPPGLSNSAIRSLAAPVSDDPMLAAAQQAFQTSVGAIEEFDEIADAVRANVDDRADELARLDGAFSTGLAVAAQLIIGDVGTRAITVTGGGFDTHGQQLELQGDLLDDLAGGLAAFWATLEAAGAADRALVVVHSEFGRRARENGSNGTDHGAAGLALVMGRSINGGLHGAIDLDDLVDGDLRATIDPRTMFTAALDWLGGDVDRILGQRHDEFPLLRV